MLEDIPHLPRGLWSTHHQQVVRVLGCHVPDRNPRVAHQQVPALVELEETPAAQPQSKRREAVGRVAAAVRAKDGASL